MNSTGVKSYAEFRYGSGEEIMEGADLCPPGFVSSGGRCKGNVKSTLRTE